LALAAFFFSSISTGASTFFSSGLDDYSVAAFSAIKRSNSRSSSFFCSFLEICLT